MAKMGRPQTVGNSVTLGVRILQPHHEMLEKIAKQRGVPRTTLLRDLATNWILSQADQQNEGEATVTVSAQQSPR